MHTIKTKSRIKGKGSKEREHKMNKLLRKVMVLALAGTMTVGMNATVFAEDTQKNKDSSLTSSGDNVVSDTATINLIKDYVRGSGSDQESSSPAEDFVFTITPYGVWNAGSSTGKADGAAYTVENMPALAKESNNVTVSENENIVTINAIKGSARKYNGQKNNNIRTEIQLNDVNVDDGFNSVGDFWYKVVENSSMTTGVIYGTNDSISDNPADYNNGHDAAYYIHVQVVNNPAYNASTGSQKFFRSVTLHKKAPIVTETDIDQITNIQYNNWAANNYAVNDNVKVNDIQNTYYAGDLSITKVVSGNSGDKDKRFEVTVTFTKPEGTIIKSDITYRAANNKTDITETDSIIANQIANNNWKKIGSDAVISSNSLEQAYNMVKFWIKDGETVTFHNIPYGVSYEIKETRPQDDTYTHSFSHYDNTKNNSKSYFNGKENSADDVTVEEKTKVENENIADSNWNVASATGSITDASDTVTITNTKESTIDIGVLTSNAPYVAMLLLVATAAFVFVHRRKNMIEE